MKKLVCFLQLAFFMLFCSSLFSQQLIFKDRTGDDTGPGTYKYPTDAVYKKGSFDLTKFTITKNGAKYDLSVEVNALLEDAWRMGKGFSLQLVFIFIDTDGKQGSGHTEGIPGLNIKFASDCAWEKAIIISPENQSRINAEIKSKASGLKNDLIVPQSIKGTSSKISASISVSDLGNVDITKCGFQVIMQSFDSFPSSTDLLTRKVNEYEEQNRFGGGNDGDCDPHVIDILAGNAKGDISEIKAQYDMLKFECSENGSSKKLATLRMVRK